MVDQVHKSYFVYWKLGSFRIFGVVDYESEDKIPSLKMADQDRKLLDFDEPRYSNFSK